MIKPATEMTSEERAAVLKAIRDGRVYWPFKNASGSELTLRDVEDHGKIDSERGIVIIGGFEMQITI